VDLVPFYLAAVLAILEGRALLAGVIYGVGIMFKGQMLLVAPLLIPLAGVRSTVRYPARKWLAGMVVRRRLIVSPWLSYGTFTWVRAGFGATGVYSDVLRKGTALNFRPCSRVPRRDAARAPH
jgi:uncharacterized membrane protein